MSESERRVLGEGGGGEVFVVVMPYQLMQGTQGQLICGGCRTLLVYPQGASNVRCALCSSVTSVPPHGAAEMAQLVCAGCRTLLMYMRGATSVQCSCCHTVNLAMELAPPPPAAAAAAVAHINCGGCGMTLMYAYGAQSVKCALCQYVTSIAMPPNMRMPLPPTQQQQQQLRPIVPTPPQQLLLPPPVSVASNTQSHHTQTVVVENPMTFDESGKLVSNVAVGVTTDTN